MTDVQQQMALITLICGVLGGLVKWIVGQWRDERKCDRDERNEDRLERKADRDAQTAATVQVALAMNTMALKFDGFEKQLTQVEGAVEEVRDEVTGRHTVPPPPSHKPPQRAQTAPLGGYRGPRRPRQESP